ncbi:hypothetical protein BaRGS_00033375 [Batillaria attramentaria]|uniref:Uncharacterized protein n=1 Tax=Batillaria attramentaria TaxID=370345 RepID=A0ABD0JK08_9CAEN
MVARNWMTCYMYLHCHNSIGGEGKPAETDHQVKGIPTSHCFLLFPQRLKGPGQYSTGVRQGTGALGSHDRCPLYSPFL